MLKRTLKLGLIPGPPVCQFSFCFHDIQMALVSIIFILELSVLDKCCLELNFQAKGIIITEKKSQKNGDGSHALYQQPAKL